MRRYLIAAAAAATITAGVVATATPAVAAPSGHIVQVQAANGHVQILLGATGLPSGAKIDPTSVQLMINGTAVNATAQVLSATAVQRTSILVIDTSGSMKGPGLAGAKTAADAFLAAVPKNVRIGLVTFSDTPTVAIAPTLNRSALHAAITKLTARGETSLYDAVVRATQVAGREGARTLVVLSDGGDTRSHYTLVQARQAVSSGKDTLDAVAFRTSEAQSSVLGSLAGAGKGQVITASQATDIAAAFRTAARDVAGQLLVTAPIPAEFADKSVNVSVTASVNGVSITDSAYALLGAAAGAAPVIAGPKPVRINTSSWVHRSATLWLALVALFLGLATILFFVGSSAARERTQSAIRRRLSFYTLTGRPLPEEQATGIASNPVARSALELADRVVVKRDLEGELSRRLEAGGIPLKPAEWLLIHLGAAILTPIVLVLISGKLAGAAIGLAVGVGAPFTYLVVKEQRRATKFLEQLPPMLQLVAGSLSAGYSLLQAIDTAAREVEDPLAAELNRALVEARLGVPIEDALDNIADRMRSKDFSWVVMAIRVQREVGGNLAEILATVAATLRERERLHRQVRVLSAEGRLSAWILGALPVIFACYLVLTRPKYIKPLYTDPIGVVMLVVLGLTMSFGVLWLRKVVRVEV